MRRGGGVRRVRVVSLSEPKGIFATTSDLEIEVEARDGRVVDVKMVVPYPWPYIWAWRAARKLHVPLASQLDPRKLNNLALNVPGRG